MSRRNFVELCLRLADDDERVYAEAWRRLGLSVDWSLSYRTIDHGPQAISQRAFLRSVARGDAYLADGPSLWDVTFGTAVAQAELEDREVAGAYVRIEFPLEDAAGGAGPGSPADGAVLVATTRPELLPACVALVAHPTTSAMPDCSAPRSARRCSASRSRSSRTGWPTRPRAPASPWSARSATPPT